MNLFSTGYAGCNKCAEQRMWRKRLRFEFRVELATNKPGMVFALDNFYKQVIRARATDDKASGFNLFAVGVVEFEAMSVTLRNIAVAVNFLCDGVWL